MQNGTKAQMSIDFLIGMTLFAAVFFFVFQFASASIAPFVASSEEVPTKTQKVADNLYFGELSGGEKGELDLTYLEQNQRDDDQIKDDLGMNQNTSGLNITVRDMKDENREFHATDRSAPDSGVSVSRTTRFGTVVDDGGISDLNEGDNVLIRVRVW